MRPKGTIYRNSAENIRGSTRLYLTDREKSLYKIKRLFGAVVASISLTAMIFFYVPPVLLDIEAMRGQVAGKFTPVSDEGPALQTISENTTSEKSQKNSDLGKDKKDSTEVRVEEFSLKIPKIDAEAQIVYNVDPFDRQKYLVALKKGVAHASTSGLPGQGRKIYLFAHSTNSPINFSRYNAVFYQLGKLSVGDEIVVDFNQEEKKYIVKQKEYVSADDVEWLLSESEEEVLILQTCDPPGTTFRRLLVIAYP